MRSALRHGAAAMLTLVLPAMGAHAVDLYPSAEEDLNPISWTGFIVAPYFGYETMNLTGSAAKGLDNPQGWRVGGELDYDYQIDRFVVGIAADAFYTWYDSNGSAQQTARLFDYETVRARLGYTFGRWLVFGTGGVAFGDLEVKNAINGAADRQMLTGWTAGGGVEWVWNNNLTLRGELAHIAFNPETFATLPAGQTLGADLDLFKIDFITRF